MYRITKLKKQIIFLSDVRLSNKNRVSAANDLAKVFWTNPYKAYDCFSNSTKNKRGVGILLDRSLNYTINSEVRDENENFLLLDLTIENTRLSIVAIYSPNVVNQDFFGDLERNLVASLS
jgi:hypothetical protein